MATMRGFREDLLDLLQHAPSVLHVLDPIDMLAPRLEVAEEADLHALLDRGLAGEFRGHVARAGAPDHHAAGAANALTHAADALDQRFAGVEIRLDDRLRGRCGDISPLDGEANQGPGQRRHPPQRRPSYAASNQPRPASIAIHYN
jgi:hypothetical protein